MRIPPGLRRAAAHSAVTAGGPNDRAVTVSNVPRLASSRPNSSALARTTKTRSVPNIASTDAWRNAVRRSLESIRVTMVSRQQEARTSPGRPPPLPRSATACGAVVR